MKFWFLYSPSNRSPDNTAIFKFSFLNSQIVLDFDLCFNIFRLILFEFRVIVVDRISYFFPRSNCSRSRVYCKIVRRIRVNSKKTKCLRILRHHLHQRARQRIKWVQMDMRRIWKRERESENVLFHSCCQWMWLSWRWCWNQSGSVWIPSTSMHNVSLVAKFPTSKLMTWWHRRHQPQEMPTLFRWIFHAENQKSFRDCRSSWAMTINRCLPNAHARRKTQLLTILSGKSSRVVHSWINVVHSTSPQRR